MRTYHAKKIWNGHISVRSNIVDKCLKENSFLKILYRDKEMTLSPQDLLDKRQQFVKDKFLSKWEGTYELWDYEFNFDNSQKEFNFKVA